MLQRWFGPKAHARLHYFTLLLFVVGMVCSKFLMTSGLILGGANILLEADYKSYYRRLSENRLVQLMLLFYLCFWLSMFWTSNWSEGFVHLRRSTGLLLIPLIIAVRPLPSHNKTQGLWSFFLAALLISSLVNSISYHFFAKQLNLIDIRDMSLFGSHIRFGMLIGFGLSLALTRLTQSRWYLLAIFWFLFYTFDSQSLTGVLTVLVVLIGHTIHYLLFRRRVFWVAMLSSLCIFSVIFLVYYLSQPLQNKETCPPNPIALKEAWQQRSKLPFDGQDLRGQQLSSTIERYVMSKNGCPSSWGIEKLSTHDIHLIELGFADIREAKGGIPARLYGLRYQIHHANNPNDHSLLERIEYWHNASSLILENWLIGIGIGDLNDQMLKRYEERASRLRVDRRLRPHNYYLTTWLNLGILGLLLLLLILFLFIKQQLFYNQIQGLLIGIAVALSLIIEDGLETQMGLTIFAFFFTFYSRRVA